MRPRESDDALVPEAHAVEHVAEVVLKKNRENNGTILSPEKGKQAPMLLSKPAEYITQAKHRRIATMIRIR